MKLILLDKLRFKNYTFRYNPASIEISSQLDIKTFMAPHLFDIIQNLGRKATIIRGHGQLFGNNTISDYLDISALFQQSDSGLLSLPQFPPFYAFFSKFSVTGSPGPLSLEYSFEFIEDQKRSANEYIPAKRTHTVIQGETLWTIAAAYGIPIEALLELNPSIPSPEQLTPGECLLILT